MKKYILVLLVLGFFLAELALHFNPALGFVIYAVLVGGVLIASGYAFSSTPQLKIITIFMIIPMLRIGELFLTINLFWRLIVSYTLLLFLVIFYTLKFKVNLGFTLRKINWLPVTMIFGIILGFIGNYFLELVKHRELLFIIPLIAFSEEMLFRGLIQKELKENYSALIGIIASSLFYFIFTFNYGFYIALYFFFVSLVSAFIYNKANNIYLCIGISLFANALVFVF